MPAATMAKANLARSPHLYDESSYRFSEVQSLSRESLDTHVDLYRGYLKQANELVVATHGGISAGDGQAPARIREAYSRRLVFELNGVMLHERFFEQLDGHSTVFGPRAGSRVLESMHAAFGSFDAWSKDVKQLADTRGVGWIATVWDNNTEHLSNVWIDLHHLGVPIDHHVGFVIDLWEHAYWADFGPKGRGRYVDAMLSETDWDVVERRAR